MRSGGDLYRFGPFELDSGRRRLSRGREPVALPDRYLELLLRLASNPGHIVAKNALSEAGWRDVAVSDNSITQAIKSLRKTLGNQNDGAPYIKTEIGQGYRFVASVERAQASQPDVAAVCEPGSADGTGVVVSRSVTVVSMTVVPAGSCLLCLSTLVPSKDVVPERAPDPRPGGLVGDRPAR
jgi:DNA-binding winged helix-turn-helix (wHTH) protein